MATTHPSRLTWIGKGTKTRYSLYRCTCGAEKEILTSSVRWGYTRSCGCLRPASYKPTKLSTIEKITAKFWRRVSVGDCDACWLWTGKIDERGYGRLIVHKKRTRAHRFAFWLTHGYYPPAVRHSCDNHPCCNPSHLLGGTQADNINDMDSRGRRRPPRGESNGNVKLTEREVIEIRTLSVRITRAALARRYGVNWTLINLIVSRKNWAHIH